MTQAIMMMSRVIITMKIMIHFMVTRFCFRSSNANSITVLSVTLYSGNQVHRFCLKPSPVRIDRSWNMWWVISRLDFSHLANPKLLPLRLSLSHLLCVSLSQEI